MSNYRISLNPATISQCDFEQSVAVAKAAGFRGIGLRHNLLKDFLGEGNSLSKARKLIEDAGLVATEAGFLNGWMFHDGIPLSGKRQRTGESEEQLLNEMAEFFSAVKELGSPPITALVATEEKGSIEQAAIELGWLCDRAADLGLRIMVELIGSAPQINCVRKARQLMEMADRHNCGLLLDSFLMFMGVFDIEEIARVPAERIYTVHISDAPANKEKAQLDMLKDRLFPGDGVIPLKELCSAVKATGYDGWFTIEIFNPDYLGIEPIVIGERSINCLTKLMQSAENLI